ncbi:multisubunit Na+/H+ antiporter MnhF subunit [Rhizobium halophytocola]|uniref:Multisubunit Na+/H+ antiporter MnhF subunit n=1 Tax=Rhizobium halophytocola TaxID=735519 RepID=A0ABS4E5V3_9HYPH|nr:multisubunit Na+/H+ antiporter MnhF subunit [Rhizobium halophytocola]
MSSPAYIVQLACYGALFLLAIAFLMTVYRVVKGPTLPDRVLALDMLVGIVIGFIAVIAIRTGYTLYIDIAISLGLVGFLATVAFARFILARGVEGEHPSEDEPVFSTEQGRPQSVHGSRTSSPAHAGDLVDAETSGVPSHAPADAAEAKPAATGPAENDGVAENRPSASVRKPRGRKTSAAAPAPAKAKSEDAAAQGDNTTKSGGALRKAGRAASAQPSAPTTAAPRKSRRKDDK